MDYFEYLDDYINESLKGEKLELFQKELKINKALQEAVENYANGVEVSKLILEIDIRDTINNLSPYKKENNGAPSQESKRNKSDSNLVKNSSTQKMFPSKLIYLILILLILSSIALFKYNKKNNQDNNWNNLLAILIRPIDPTATKSIKDISKLNSFDKGKLYFNLRNYSNSEIEFKQFNSTSNHKDSISRGHLYLGFVHLYQKEIKEAIYSWTLSNDPLAKKNLDSLQSHLDIE